ncbi:hypothetical protein FVE85_0857 [Porphyridium purpureum]|uniref:Uncharacterized protein n=1 Tax=Porphyridium purpureum TaxID=35688 RepID=A0A5J4Z1C1_PORPP|nr:hypothetical protein FVE85_0857 [Porphyridium purpureum]|eukprot:POR3438..scf208_2
MQRQQPVNRTRSAREMAEGSEGARRSLGFVGASPTSSPARMSVKQRKRSSCGSRPAVLNFCQNETESEQPQPQLPPHQQQQQQQQQQLPPQQRTEEGVGRRDVLRSALVLAGLVTPLAANQQQAGALYLPPPPAIPDKVQVWVPTLPTDLKAPKPLDLNLEKNFQLQKPMNEVRQMQRNFDKFMAPMKDPNRRAMIARVQEALPKAKELEKLIKGPPGPKLVKAMEDEECAYAKRYMAVWITPVPGYISNVLSRTTGEVPDKAKKMPDQLKKRIEGLDKALTSKNRYTALSEVEDLLDMLDSILKSPVMTS